MKVVKFGGSSLADGPAVNHALSIIKSDPERQVIVVSAPGKRFENDIKVTDLLIKYAQAALAQADEKMQALQQEIFNRYVAIADYFGLASSDLTAIKQQLAALPQAAYPTKQYLLGAFKAHGERLNAQLISLILQKQGLKARYVDPKEAGIKVTGTPNNATVLPESYAYLEQFNYQADEKLIFPGFFGFTLAGHIATFSRGGSDITGAILARGFHARLYENFTDVDAIFAANPAVVDHPKPIKVMTYREMRELSYAGFSVFHDEALIPAIGGSIPINVKNTAHPDHPGTMIVPEKGFVPSQIVTGIASGKHFSALYMHKYLLNKENGFTLKILEILNKYGVPYEHMPSGIDDITIIFDRHKLTDELIDAICEDVQNAVNPDRLEWINDYAITMIVGEGMQSHNAISGIIAALANKVHVSMVNQWASEISVMIGTPKKDADLAVSAIYDYFFN